MKEDGTASLRLANGFILNAIRHTPFLLKMGVYCKTFYIIYLKKDFENGSDFGGMNVFFYGCSPVTGPDDPHGAHAESSRKRASRNSGLEFSGCRDYRY